MTTASSATVTLLSAGLLVCSATALRGADAAGHPAAASQQPAAGGVQQALTNQLVNTLSLSPNIDVATIASVKFFVTADGGATWTLGQETAVPPGTKERPKFKLSVAHDGVYGIMTSVTYRQGKAAEPDPRPGQPPLYAVVVDTMPPTVARFEAALTSIGADKARVHCAWSTSDAHPAPEPVAIEVSADGGQHFTTVQHGAAAGEADLEVPLAAGVKQLQVRLGAVDLAKNAVATPVKLLDLAKPEPIVAPTPPAGAAPAAAPVAAAAVPQAPSPTAVQPAPTAPSPAPAPAPAATPAPPADPLAEFAQAAKTLPLPSDFGIGPPPVLPEIAPVAQDQPAKPKPAPIPAPAKAAEAPPAAAPAPVKPPAKAADVVVQGAPTTDVGDDKPLAGTNALDQEFYRKLAELHPAPSRSNARQPVREPASTAEDDARASAPRPAPAPRPIQPPAAAPAAPAASGSAGVKLADGQRPRPEPAGFIDAATALQTLGDARIAVLGGRIDEACDAYERLFASGLAKTAALEESHVLLREQRPRDALTAIGSLPPELVTDGVRLDQGRALLALGRPDPALAALTRIRDSAPESRPALLLIARCYRALGKDGEARKLLEFLSRGGDQVASEAAAEAGGGKR